MRTHIRATSRHTVTLVPIADVHYFKAEDKYVAVHYNDRSILIEESLKALHADLGDAFLQVHRNALVRESLITTMRKTPEGKVQVSVNDTWLDVSRRHAPTIRKMLRARSK